MSNMELIFWTTFIFAAFLPTTVIMSVVTYRRRDIPSLIVWGFLVLLGALWYPYAVHFGLHSPDSRGYGGFLVLALCVVWIVQLMFIGILALVRKATNLVASRARGQAGTESDTALAGAEAGPDTPSRQRRSYAFWIVLGLLVLLIYPLVSSILEGFLSGFLPGVWITPLRWLTRLAGVPILPLALAFIATGHRWRAHAWAVFWYIVAVPGVIGLVIRLFPSLVQPGSLLVGLYSGVYGNWASVYPAIVVLAAVCCVVALRLWLAKANPMWRWAFTWASIGYVFLALLGLAMR